MAIELIDKIKHASGGKIVDAADIEMSDGRDLETFVAEIDKTLDALVEQMPPPVLPGAETIEPEKYYDFGSVESLTVALAEKADGRAHLYQFEFVPNEGWTGLTIMPEPVWCNEPQYPVGKRVLVAVQMGMAVMGIA